MVVQFHHPVGIVGGVQFKIIIDVKRGLVLEFELDTIEVVTLCIGKLQIVNSVDVESQ